MKPANKQSQGGNPPRPRGRGRESARKPPKPQGNLKPHTRSKLAIIAGQAYAFQKKVGNIENGVSEDDWRRAEVMKAVKRPGISACDGIHFRDVMAHFLTLQGKDDEAFGYAMRTGKVTDSGEATDTHEKREEWLAMISTDLRLHAELADLPAAPESPEFARAWHAIKAHLGPIREGYVVFIAVQKFGIKKCLFEKLGDRLNSSQLETLAYTVRNRINAREGAPKHGGGRNKKQNSEEAKAARKAAANPGELAPREIPGLDAPF